MKLADAFSLRTSPPGRGLLALAPALPLLLIALPAPPASAGPAGAPPVPGGEAAAVTSPLPPPPPPAPGPPPRPEVVRISEEVVGVGDVRINTRTKAITFPAEVNQISQQIEYVIVHVDGKTHESLLRTRVRPFQLQVALLLAGHRPTDALFRDRAAGGEPPPPPPALPAKPLAQGQLTITLAWDEGGKRHRDVPLEAWVFNIERDGLMEGGAWTFTGSRFFDDGQFAAELEGNMAALYLDANSMVNNRLPDGQNDEIWIPAPGVVPPVGTPVQVEIQRRPRPSAPGGE